MVESWAWTRNRGAHIRRLNDGCSHSTGIQEFQICNTIFPDMFDRIECKERQLRCSKTPLKPTLDGFQPKIREISVLPSLRRHPSRDLRQAVSGYAPTGSYAH